ncbi:hypothetical protein GUITHDRAFT_103580 [Guillardia theta CCMP2712]|uniref:Polycystin cation channel PKD1/PKD2 domain-containing protein n=1 Tax=Guillardia theta (strain CCMP2712) TaxID=905079 RepID=L1JSD6_GUITC|nr:hypothetical protein GUITHDRAFT_103580 [Guillardia theta CCMP2712]EKX50993.1 hypothetical protein GUITHDRAFT_103580 [Guillardia theta CCMP2712]|eukprot:XP_005837973.1 hypothetical protein GUITHDRAFT_103580 [Guillardia theta CCMP2712]
MSAQASLAYSIPPFGINPPKPFATENKVVNEREQYIPLLQFMNVLSSSTRFRHGVFRLCFYLVYAATFIFIMVLEVTNGFGPPHCGGTGQCLPYSVWDQHLYMQSIKDSLYETSWDPANLVNNIYDMQTFDDLKSWITKVYVPTLWPSNGNATIPYYGRVPVDPIVVKFSVRQENLCSDNQGFDFSNKRCLGHLRTQSFGPPEDSERWRQSNQDAAQPGYYALLAWRDRFFTKAVKKVSADGYVSYHVPLYNPGFSPRFGNLSQVRVWNVSTAEQALNFFAMAETDGLFTHKTSSLSMWTTFYFPTTDITTVVRSVFEIHDSGRASICEDTWLCADYGALIWTRDFRRMYSSGNGIARLVLEIVFLTLTLIQLFRELRQFYYSPVIMGSRSAYVLGTGGFWNFLDLICFMFIAPIYFLKILMYVTSSEDPESPQRFWAASLPVVLWSFHSGLTGWLQLFLIFRFFKYLEFSNALGIVGDTFQKAAKDLVIFLFVFFLVIVAYSYAGYYFYRGRMYEFSTVPKSVNTVFSIMFGQVDFQSFGFNTDTSLGSFSIAFLWSITILVYLILINMFLAIILSAFDMIREDLKRYRLERLQGNKYVPPGMTILEFFLPLLTIARSMRKIKRVYSHFRQYGFELGFLSTEFFPEGMVMRMLLDAQIMSARRPPLISRVLGYNSSRQEFLIEWKGDKTWWSTHPKLMSYQPVWLSKAEIMAIKESSHSDRSEILEIDSDKLISWESRYILTRRVLTRQAKDDLKRLVNVPDIYDDTFWTRGNANLIAYSVNMDPDYLETKHYYLAGERTRTSQDERERLRMKLETGNKLTVNELEALFIKHLMPTAARQKIEEKLQEDRDGLNQMLSNNFLHFRIKRLVEAISESGSEVNECGLTSEEATELIDESKQWTRTIFNKFGTRRHISDFPNSLGALGIEEYERNANDENYQFAYSLGGDDDLTDISLKQVMKGIKKLQQQMKELSSGPKLAATQQSN